MPRRRPSASGSGRGAIGSSLVGSRSHSARATLFGGVVGVARLRGERQLERVLLVGRRARGQAGGVDRLALGIDAGALDVLFTVQVWPKGWSPVTGLVGFG